MKYKNQNINYLRNLIKKCFSTSPSILSNENLKNIKEFRKLTNLSLSTCKKVLIKNNYNIENSINYIFQNFNINFQNEKNELKEGYHCMKVKDNLIGLIELNCYNDLICENIFFKELLVNLCNNLIKCNANKKINEEYLDKETISHYMHLFYKDNKIIVDKRLEHVSVDRYKQIYFNRNINQLINYTSLILNDYIFLRKYATFNLDNVHSEKAYIIKNCYYHKEVRIEDFILCKGFSFAFLFIESKKKLEEQTKCILEKLSLLICINILIYKSRYCTKSYGFNMYECFKLYFINSPYNKNFGSIDKKTINEVNAQQLTEIDDRKQNVENTYDFLLNNVQAFHILGDYLEKENYKKLNFFNKENITFFELITSLEKELDVKIYTKIMYSLLNEHLVIL